MSRTTELVLYGIAMGALGVTFITSGGWFPMTSEATMVRLTVVVVALTIAVVIYAAKTLRAAEASTKAANRSLEVAKESLDFFTKPLIEFVDTPEERNRWWPPSPGCCSSDWRNRLPLPLRLPVRSSRRGRSPGGRDRVAGWDWLMAREECDETRIHANARERRVPGHR